jgi:hypothetical protein
MGGHTLDDCHLLINVVKGQEFIKAHPDVAERFHKSHKTFFLHKPRPCVPHVHNILDNQPNEEDLMILQHDNHPSL